MDRETIKWVLEILRNSDFGTAMEVITNLDVDCIVSEMKKDQRAERVRLIDADKLRNKLLMIDCMEDAVEIVDIQPYFELKEIKADSRKETIDECKNIVKKFIGYLDEDMIGRINLKLEQLKEQKDG